MSEKQMTLDSAIAAELRAERSALNIPYNDLAERTGISIAQIYRFMGGQRSLNMPQYEAIAGVLGLTPLEVLLRAEKRRAEHDR